MSAHASARESILRAIYYIEKRGRGAYCNDAYIRRELSTMNVVVEDVRRRVNELEKMDLVWSEWPEDQPRGGTTMKLRHLTSKGQMWTYGEKKELMKA